MPVAAAARIAAATEGLQSVGQVVHPVPLDAVRARFRRGLLG
jgi:hypothetical protein